MVLGASGGGVVRPAGVPQHIVIQPIGWTVNIGFKKEHRGRQDTGALLACGGFALLLVAT